MHAWRIWSNMFRRQNRGTLDFRKTEADKEAEAEALDLRACNVGMTCEEYSMLFIAGPGRGKVPSVVQERMDKHYDACAYHRSSRWIQSAVGTPVTEELEKEALAIIAKYSQ